MNITFCGPNWVLPLVGLGIFEFTFLNNFTYVRRLFSARSAWLSISLCVDFGIFLLEITFDALIPDASVWRGWHPSTFCLVTLFYFDVLSSILTDVTWIELLLIRPLWSLKGPSGLYFRTQH